MDYSAQATQLFVVLVLLIGAYFGVMVWTRKVNNRPPGEGGGRFFRGWRVRIG